MKTIFLTKVKKANIFGFYNENFNSVRRLKEMHTLLKLCSVGASKKLNQSINNSTLVYTMELFKLGLIATASMPGYHANVRK